MVCRDERLLDITEDRSALPLWEVTARLALTGELVRPIFLSPTASIRELRHEISAAIGRSPGVQQTALDVLFQGRALSEEDSLKAAGLTHGAGVEVVRRIIAPVLTASTDWTARIWDAYTGECLLVIEDHQVLDELQMAVFSPNNSMLFTACRDCTAKLFDAVTGVKLHTFGVPKFQISNDQQQDARLGEYIGNVTTVAFSPDGQSVLTGGDTTVRFWDVKSGASMLVIEQTHGVTSATYTQDGNWILLASRRSTHVKIYSASSGKCRQTIACVDVHGAGNQRHNCQCTLSSATISLDGALALTVVSRCYTAELWDVESGGRIAISEFVHDAEVTSVCISPDNKFALTSSLDRTAKLWALTSGSLTHELTFKGHKASVNSASFSPDAQNVITSSADCSARIWDVPTGQCAQILCGHRKNVCWAAFGARL
jgi:WD40 repeat protein